MNTWIIRTVLTFQSTKAAESNNLDVGNRYTQSWSPSQVGWIKFNTDVSRDKMNQKMTINYVCRYSIGRIIKKG